MTVARAPVLMKTNILMNSKTMIAMKKIVLSMVVAAAALVGCQKSEDFATGKTISLSAEMSQPETGRTALVENEGVYSAIWKSGDKLTLFELADGAYTLYESNALTADAATASFTFDGVAAKEAASFRYVAGTNITGKSTVNNLRVELPSAQAPATMTTFDGAADILLSRPIDRESQPVSEALTFSTARVSAVVKLMIKNLALADGEKVEKVVFSCEQPIAGLFQVGVDDLEVGEYPVPFQWREEAYSVSITLPEAQSSDFAIYFSCLPATLKAGEGYTVTLTTNQSGYHKVSTLTADMALEAGNITTVSVNMSGATTKTDVLKFNDAYEYVIACKAADGKTYLMNRAATSKNPTAAEVSSLGLTVDATTGAISGEIPNQYRWKAKASTTETAGVYNAEFYYTVGDVPYNLIATSNAQGLAINSELAGAQSNPYVKELTVKTKGNGYAIMNTTGGASMYVNTNQGQFRFTAEHSDVVYFYRVNTNVPQQSLYPVITKSTAITPGTYAVLYNHATNGYVALKNDATVSSADGGVTFTNTLPVATPIAEVAMTMDESGMVTSASVADAYKWVLTPNDKGKWIIRSAVNMNHYLYMRDNGGSGVSIGVPTEVTTANKNFTNDWTFSDDAVKGMQGQVSGGARYLYSNGTQFLAGNNAGTGLILVKLSGSTEQL